MQVSVTSVQCDDEEFLSLVKQLTEMLVELNGEKNAYYAPLNDPSSLTAAVVVYVDGKAAGCGGFRPVDVNTIEIKRMFVLPEYRGMGLGRSILAKIIDDATQAGYAKAILETSKRLTAANQLYERSGFTVIPNYGPYIGMEDSICMSMLLSPLREPVSVYPEG